LTLANSIAGVETNIYYSASHMLASSTDARGTVTTNFYDLLGNLTNSQVGYYSNSTFIVLTSTTHGYDVNGNRTVETNALGVQTRYRYDAQNRVVAVTNAYGTADQATNATLFDVVGRVAGTINALGVTTAFGYDAQGRCTS